MRSWGGHSPLSGESNASDAAPRCTSSPGSGKAELVLLERAMPSAQARKAAAETRRIDSAWATETTMAERMERTSARRRRDRADHPEEKKLMVTATICRLCENSAIIDPMVAEIRAHQAHPHHKRRANPCWKG